MSWCSRCNTTWTATILGNKVCYTCGGAMEPGLPVRVAVEIEGDPVIVIDDEPDDEVLFHPIDDSSTSSDDT